ncbi:MAG: hypothetical protein ABSC53_11055 [Bacteroidota bacterium]
MTQTLSTPLYLDWSFWAVLVAAVALVLSQLPPIHTLLMRAKLELELYSRMHITHKVGNPNAQLHLIITNVGGRPIKVKRITLAFRRDGKDVAVLPAQNYYQNPGDSATVLLVGFALKSKEEWAHTVGFLNYFSRPDEKRYRDAEALLKKDIFEKRKLIKNKTRIVEAERNHVTDFLHLFDEKFIWLAGDYELRVSVECSDKRANTSKDYRFTLFESDSNTLSSSKSDYKLGDGIYWDSGNHPGVIVQIVEA